MQNVNYASKLNGDRNQDLNGPSEKRKRQPSSDQSIIRPCSIVVPTPRRSGTDGDPASARAENKLSQYQNRAVPLKRRIKIWLLSQPERPLFQLIWMESQRLAGEKQNYIPCTVLQSRKAGRSSAPGFQQPGWAGGGPRRAGLGWDPAAGARTGVLRWERGQNLKEVCSPGPKKPRSQKSQSP